MRFKIIYSTNKLWIPSFGFLTIFDDFLCENFPLFCPSLFFGIFLIHFFLFIRLCFFFSSASCIFTFSSFEAFHVAIYTHKIILNNDTQRKAKTSAWIGNRDSPNFLLCVFLFTDISTSLAGSEYVNFNNNAR